MPLIAMKNTPPFDDRLRAGTSIHGFGALPGREDMVHSDIQPARAAGAADASSGGNVTNYIQAASEGIKQALTTAGAVQQLLKPAKPPAPAPQPGPAPRPQPWYSDWKVLALIGVGVATLATAGYFVVSKPKPKVSTNPRRRRRR